MGNMLRVASDLLSMVCREILQPLLFSFVSSLVVLGCETLSRSN